MHFEDLAKMLFFVMLALVVGSFIYKSLRHGGVKGAMFGARIEHTFGQVDCNGVKFGSMVLKVHKLSGGLSEKAIGIEMVAKTFASYDMMPMTLSAAEARKLAALLETAAGSRPSRQ